MTLSLKTFTGKESLREVLNGIGRHEGVLNGEGGIFARRALKAGMMGATAGAPFGTGVGFLMSTHDMSPALQAPLGGALYTGFALSIPIDFRSAVRQVQSAVLDLMDAGKIPGPPGGFADEAAKMRYARALALQEMIARLSNSSSAKAITMAPRINAAILASPLVHVPPEVAEIAFMGAAAPMENISKLVGTIWETKVERPRAMDEARHLVLATPGGFDEGTQEKALANFFARRWPSSVARVITAGAEPPRPVS